jgi:phosphoenolpyruvate carboxykinase (ATP)
VYERHPIFNIQMPSTCPGVPDIVLDPRRTWQDGAAYDAQARTLARMFVENFQSFERDVSNAVRQAGPTI